MKTTLGWMGLLAAALIAINTLMTLPAAADLRQIDLIAAPQGTVLKLHADQQLPVTIEEARYNRLVLRIDNAGHRATILTNFAQASNVDHVVVKHLPDEQVEVTILGHRLSEPSVRFSLMEPDRQTPSPLTTTTVDRAPIRSATASIATRPAVVKQPVHLKATPAASAPVLTPALQLPELPAVNTSALIEQANATVTDWLPQLLQAAPYGLVGLLVLGLGIFIWRKARQLATAPEPALSYDAPTLPSLRKASAKTAIPARPTLQKQGKLAPVTLPPAPVFMADGSEAPVIARKAVSSYQGQTKAATPKTGSAKTTKPVSALAQSKPSQPAASPRTSVASVAQSASNPDIQAFLEAVASQMSQDGRPVLTQTTGKKPATAKA